MTSALAYPLGRGVAKVEGDLRELGGFVTNCPPTHFVADVIVMYRAYLVISMHRAYLVIVMYRALFTV